MTKPYAEVIGDPIAHTKSPLIHNFWLAKLGIDAEYRACQVKPDELAEYLETRRGDLYWRGCNVTIPHKQAAMICVDRLTDAATKVGAVNTVWRDEDRLLASTNTDLDGVAAAIDGAAIGEAVVLGSGGAARAAFALLAARPEFTVTVLARSTGKALEATRECGLEARIMPLEAGSGAFAGASLVINATQLGMTGQLPMPSFVLDEVAKLVAGGLVFDMVYAPLETQLLRAARDAGLATADGLTMLVGQAATAFEVFFHASPPREHDAELRSILRA
jgi:shikimate dehydrogenase